jgi:hypothetical protein
MLELRLIVKKPNGIAMIATLKIGAAIVTAILMLLLHS